MRTAQVSAVARPGIKSAVKPSATGSSHARLAAGALLSQAAAAAAAVPAARAADADAVDATVDAITSAVKIAGGVIKGGVNIVSAGAKALKAGYDAAAPVVQQGVDAVAPVVRGAVKATGDAAAPAVKQAAPLVQDALSDAVRSVGVDVDSVARTTGAAVKTAASGASAAQPLLSVVWQFLTSSDPATLGQLGLAGAGLYLFGPLLARAAARGARGFAGEISAVAALDALGRGGGALLVDIRSEADKERSGVPDVPNAASRVVELELAAIADRKLRGSLRDAGATEAQITALQIASLRQLSKGTRVILLDRNCSAARSVARDLSRLGFSNVFVVRGGFDGGGGWAASKLLVKPFVASGGGRQGAQLALPLPRTTSTRTASTRPATPPAAGGAPARPGTPAARPGTPTARPASPPARGATSTNRTLSGRGSTTVSGRKQPPPPPGQR